MIGKIIILIAIAIVIIAILIVPIIYLSYKNQKASNVDISRGQDPHRKMCHSYPVSCEGQDEDFCSRTCLDNMEYSCQDVHQVVYDKDKKAKINKTSKFCLPERNAKQYPCDLKKGCVPTWTGWGDTNRMEWDSLCMFPDYFGGNGCTNTPGVCTLNGKSFMADKDYSKNAPQFSDCQLPSELQNNYRVIERTSDLTPLIVLNNQCLFYRDVSPTQNEDTWPEECKKH